MKTSTWSNEAVLSNLIREVQSAVALIEHAPSQVSDAVCVDLVGAHPKLREVLDQLHEAKANVLERRPPLAS